jgi:uncharacterized membrane protein
MQPNARGAVLGWLAANVVLGGAAPLFHVQLAGDLMSRELSGIALPPSEVASRVEFAVIGYVLAASATTWFVLLPPPAHRTLIRSGLAGAIVGLVGDGTWNLLNLMNLPRWSLAWSLADTGWHTAIGFVVGMLIFWIASRFEPQNTA